MRYIMRMSAAEEFFAMRRSWLRVETIVRHDGRADVALVIDGTYKLKEHADEMSEFFQDWIEQIVAQTPSLSTLL